MRDRGYSHGGLTRPSLCPLSSCPCPHGAQCSCEGRGMVTSGRCTNVGRSQALLERGPPLLWSLHPGGVLPCSPAPWSGSPPNTCREPGVGGPASRWRKWVLPQLIAWGLAWATQRWCPGLQFPLWQEGRLPAQGSRRLGGIGGRLGGVPQWSLAQVRIPDMRSGWGCPRRPQPGVGGQRPEPARPLRSR